MLYNSSHCVLYASNMEAQCFCFCTGSYLKFMTAALQPEVLLQGDETLFDFIFKIPAHTKSTHSVME